MISIGDKTVSNAVHLTDPDIERGFAISNVLDILVDIGKYVWKDLDYYEERFMSPSAARFALKYEVNSVIAAMKAWLFRSVAQYPPEGGEYILEAAVLGEWALCGRLIASLDHAPNFDLGRMTPMLRMMDWRG